MILARPSPRRRTRERSPQRFAAVRARHARARRAAVAPRTARSSRCPTRARSSGTSRTRRGSSRPSCSRAHEPRLRAVPSGVPRPLQLVLQRASATGTRGPERGLLSRPALADVLAYRAHVDAGDARSCLRDGRCRPSCATLVELGLHHEQQHQELILTDVKHLLSRNPLRPPTSRRWPLTPVTAAPLRWHRASTAGSSTVGHEGDGFAFDNETPAPSASSSRRSSSPRTR